MKKALSCMDLEFAHAADRGASSSRAARGALGGWTKRVFDILFSILALLALAPLFLCVAVTIRLFSRGAVIYRHQRVGHDGQLFYCLKFRTMVQDAEQRLEEMLARDPAARAEFAEFQKLRHDPRIVPVIGEFLRKSSLDEVPQFLNVLRGEMSVVGPRPVTTGEMERYGQFAGDYLRARPGITGAWQVSGRSNLSYEVRVGADRDYVRNWSLIRDIRIVVATVKVVLFRQGAH